MSLKKIKTEKSIGFTREEEKEESERNWKEKNESMDGL